jgi:hypothetical protein
MPENEKKLTFTSVQSPEYKSVYTTGIMGGLTPDDAYLIFFKDSIRPETDPETGNTIISEIIRESQVEVHMSPSQFKRIFLWMQSRVVGYENVWGEIPMEPIKKKEVEKTISGNTELPQQ